MKLDNTRSRVVSLQQGMLMCAVATVLCLAPQTHAQVSYTNLHVFTGGTEGSAPVGLMVDGGTLYGTTINGGVSDAGIVFSLSTSGTAFTVLHRFNGVDSANPYGSLASDEEWLYGTALNGNAGVFKLAKDGSAYTVLHSWVYTPLQGYLGGSSAMGGPTVDGGNLYGTAYSGGTNTGAGGGVVFRIDTNYTVLHHFGGISDGFGPLGTMVRSETNLWGTTQRGGTNTTANFGLGFGTIFTMATDGTGYRLLHSFAGSPNADGEYGNMQGGGLMLVGTTLLGVTEGGGIYNRGVLFSIKTDGSDYRILHHFGSYGDGRSPSGPPVLHGTKLYGKTLAGGTNDAGTIFQIGTDGTGYRTIYSFAGGTNGSATIGGLSVAGDVIYGPAHNNAFGVVFALSVRLPDLLVSSMDAPLAGTAGQTINVSYAVTNSGPGMASVEGASILWNDHIYLSTNIVLNAGSIDLGVISRNEPVATGGNYSTNVAVTLPVVPRGDYFLIITTDNDDALLETNELNNTSAIALRIVDPILDMPIAEAGTNRSCFVAQTVALDGSASINAQHFMWSIVSRPAGSACQLTGPSTASPQIMPDLPGQYTAQLLVDFYGLTSTPDTVTVTASWVNWTVGSQHGQPIPGTGVHNYAFGAVITNVVSNTEQMGETQYVCTGWALAGHDPTSGISNRFSVVVTNDAELTWAWMTNYWLEVQTNGSGTVSQATGWYSAGSTQIVSSSPTYGWLFTGWTGDMTAGHTITNLELQMNRPWHVVATFSDDPDADGLKNVDEWSQGSDPWNPDTDGDGFDDLWEVQHGWITTSPNSDVLAYILARPAVFGVYAATNIGCLAPGALIVGAISNTVHLSIQLETSPDLLPTAWTNAGPPVEWSMPAATNKAFYRVGVKD